MRSWLLFLAAALVPIGLAVGSLSADPGPPRSCTPATTDVQSPAPSESFCPVR